MGVEPRVYTAMSDRPTDASGNDFADQGHFPFGETWYFGSAGTNRQFTSYYRDSETGNDYAKARFGVNRLGRFASPDPLPGSPGDPQSLNRYSYVRNMPTVAIDPTGKDPCTLQPLQAGADGEQGGDLTSVRFLISAPEPEPQDVGCIGSDGGGDCYDYSVLDAQCPLGGGTGPGNDYCLNYFLSETGAYECPILPPPPPPPPPTPTCFAQLKNRTVDYFLARIFHVQHDFWYVQDESGGQSFLEAGPSNSNGTGFLQLKLKPYPGDPDDTSAHAGFTAGPSPCVCYDVFIMELSTVEFPQTANVYRPLKGPNSNSAAHYLAIQGGFNPSPPFWSLGWNTPVIGAPLIY
jgi:RHS repeat-associated protein